MKITSREIALSGLIFVLIFALTIAVIVLFPRRYQSRAKLLLKVGRESVTLDPTVTTAGETLSLHRTRESEINTTLDMMKNRTVLAEVALRVGHDKIFRGTPKDLSEEKSSGGGLFSGLLDWISIDPIDESELVMIELESNLSIEATRESGVVEIRYQTKSPEVAQQVVENWTEVYQQLHTQMSHTGGARQFFEDEENDARERLDEKRRQLCEAKEEAGLVTILGQQRMIESQILASRQAVMATEALLAASETRSKELHTSLQSVPERTLMQESTVSNRAHEEMRHSLFELELLEKQLESTLTSDNPRVIAIRNQRQKAAEILDGQDEQTHQSINEINPISQVIKQQFIEESANCASLERKLEIEKQQLELLLAESMQLNMLEHGIVQLESEVEVLAAHHRVILDKLEQARLNDALEVQQITSINTIQPATLEARPATPNKKLCGLVGIFAAFCGAIGVPLMRRAVIQISNDSPLEVRSSSPRISPVDSPEFVEENGFVEASQRKQTLSVHPR